MANRGIEEAKRYHQTTKHSYQSVRTNTHTLDWDNRPSVYKVYSDLALAPLPRGFAWPQADVLQAVSSPECNEEKALGLKGLSQILFFSARGGKGCDLRRRIRKGETKG